MGEAKRKALAVRKEPIALDTFVRLTRPHKRFEAISSRPRLLHGVATQTQHAGQKRLTIASTMPSKAVIQAIPTSLAGFLRSLKATVEPLTDAKRLRAILTRAFAKFMLATAGPPAMLPVQPSAN